MEQVCSKLPFANWLGTNGIYSFQSWVLLQRLTTVHSRVHILSTLLWRNQPFWKHRNKDINPCIGAQRSFWKDLLHFLHFWWLFLSQTNLLFLKPELFATDWIPSQTLLTDGVPRYSSINSAILVCLAQSQLSEKKTATRTGTHSSTLVRQTTFVCKLFALARKRALKFFTLTPGTSDIFVCNCESEQKQKNRQS